MSDDLLAVTLLDVRWTPRAVRSLLGDTAAESSERLKRIDNQTELGSEAANEQLNAALPLWELLDGLDYVGDTKASKLLARKRPRLIPITDDLITSAAGTRGHTWLTLQYCFEDPGLRSSLDRLRPDDYKGLSLLRIFDVAIWMLYSRAKAVRRARRDAGL